MKKGKNVMKKHIPITRLYKGVFFVKRKKRWLTTSWQTNKGFDSQKAAAEALAKHLNCTLGSLRLNKKNKNIQKKAMKDKKKKAQGRLKKIPLARTVDDVEAKISNLQQKDKKNLKRPAALPGDPEQASKKGPETTILKGPFCPDVSATGIEYYKQFKLMCMIIPASQGSSRRRIVVGVKNLVQAAGAPLVFFVDGHMLTQLSTATYFLSTATCIFCQRPRVPILKGPLMPDASLVPPEDIFKPFQLTCTVIPPKARSSANRLVVGVVVGVDWSTPM